MVTWGIPVWKPPYGSPWLVPRNDTFHVFDFLVKQLARLFEELTCLATWKFYSEKRVVNPPTMGKDGSKKGEKIGPRTKWWFQCENSTINGGFSLFCGSNVQSNVAKAIYKISHQVVPLRHVCWFINLQKL
jgi:hypothetical protein